MAVRDQHAHRVIAVVGRRLREHREALGLSQEQVAVRARLTHKFVGQVERGETNVSVASVVYIADALGCDVGGLFSPK
jgi:transcriptional regulator with XRE-family HTH domain